MTKSRDTIARRISGMRRRVLGRRGVSGEQSRSYLDLRKTFLDNGRASIFDRAVRLELVRQFEAIDRRVPLATTPADGLILAEMLLNMEAEGEIVECGCYLGGSTCKLSLVARLLNRRLMVFDSFEGLPETSEGNWRKGSYAGPLETVTQHVERYGSAEHCSFVKGWFEDTLHERHLPHHVALAFTDVDLPSSAKLCLAALWPRLSPRGIFASHDAAFPLVLRELYNEELWTGVLGEFPPVLFGAGFGICDAAPRLGFFLKCRPLSREYLRKISLTKRDVRPDERSRRTAASQAPS